MLALGSADVAIARRRNRPTVTAVAIDHIDLSRIDLNLLVALDALLDERSVTRAAARVGIGQSAMSSSLARLRRLFDDELLTRAPDGMRPTPRALKMVEPLRATLRQVQALVHREERFDPATLERTFTVSLPDSVEVLLGPRLIAQLRREAPGIRLLLRSVDRTRVLDELDADRVDLAIGLFSEGQLHHKQRLLYRDSYVVLFNAALIGLQPPIGLDDYLRFPHVLTSLRETAHGVVDDALALIGRVARPGGDDPALPRRPVHGPGGPGDRHDACPARQCLRQRPVAQRQPGAGASRRRRHLDALARLLRS